MASTPLGTKGGYLCLRKNANAAKKKPQLLRMSADWKEMNKLFTIADELEGT